MSSHQELIDALSALDTPSFQDIIAEVIKRRETARPQDRTPPRDPSRDEFAAWIAQRHLSSDIAIERVIYLPKGSPELEIRLLEINRLLNEPDSEDIVPLNFSPWIEGIPFTVSVAEISRDQWEKSQAAENLDLPEG